MKDHKENHLTVMASSKYYPDICLEGLSTSQATNLLGITPLPYKPSDTS
jgi:hypothetical protein